MKFIAVVLFLGLFLFASAEDSHVKDLVQGDFDDYINGNPLTLVKFYAPWCGHCKALAPEYDAAAETLADNDKIQLARVDCTEEKDLCSRYGVRGYPTLKVFAESTEGPEDYEGPRKADGIVSFMKKRSLPAVSEVEDKAAIDELTKDEEIAVVGFFKGAGAEREAFDKAANKLRSDALFAAVADDSNNVAGEYGVTAPAIVLLRKFDEPQVNYEGDLTSTADIESFFKGNSLPVFGEIGPENFQKYVSQGKPLVWFFLDPSDETTGVSAREAAPSVSDKLSFVHLDGVKWAQHGKSFGVNSLPGIVIEDREGGFNYLYDGEISGAALEKWAKDFLNGDLQPTLKSQDPPADNSAPVTVVVGSTYEEIVLDPTKDVLLEFYAPWCGHCKSLAPKYDELGEAFKDVDSVVIAKIDATENDTPVKVTGFPTIKFFPANDKTPMAYSGDRTAEAMEAFVRKHGSTLGDEAPASGEDVPTHEEL